MEAMLAGGLLASKTATDVTKGLSEMGPVGNLLTNEINGIGGSAVNAYQTYEKTYKNQNTTDYENYDFTPTQAMVESFNYDIEQSVNNDIYQGMQQASQNQYKESYIAPIPAFPTKTEKNSNVDSNLFKDIYYQDYANMAFPETDWGYINPKLFVDNESSYQPSFWEKTKNRAFGALRLAGGAAQMAAAAAITDLTGGLLSPIAIGVGLHGADDIIAGGHQVWSGMPERNMTEKALETLGASERTASWIDAGIGLTGIVGEGRALSRMYQAQDAYKKQLYASAEARIVEHNIVGIDDKNILAMKWDIGRPTIPPTELISNESLGVGSGHNMAMEIFPGGEMNVVSGHGTYWNGTGGFIEDGYIKIPEGTALTIARHDVGLPDKIGQLMESTQWEKIGRIMDSNSYFEERLTGMSTKLPGSFVKNYTLGAPDKSITIYKNSTSVNKYTKLEDILKPNQGCVTWSACTIDYFF